MKFISMFLVFPVMLMAASFTDDFESYTPGDDLDTSLYWVRTDPGGSLTVTEYGSGQVVESSWDGNEYLGYGCLGSMVCSDAVVSADVMLNGSETMAGLASRLDPVNGAGYMGGIYRLYGSIGATMILYVNSSGDYSILANDYFYPLNEDTWYEVDFEVTGSSPVNLTLSVNGVVCSYITDSEYNIESGMTGLGSIYQADPSLVLIDDFAVVDYVSALNRTTFGAIKASFR